MAIENIDVLPVVSKENTKLLAFFIIVILLQFEGLLDQIEQQTGIDFFPGLNDVLENHMEESINQTGWSF